MNTVLVLDDDQHIVRTLEIMLRDDGYVVFTAPNGEAAIEVLGSSAIDIAFVDLQLPGIGGEEVLRHVRRNSPGTEVVIITAYGSIESAVEAIKDGAFDYLTKPFSPDQVRHRLAQLDRLRRLRNEVTQLQRRLGELPFRGGFVTENDVTLRLLETARHVAQSDTTVLISGETGTGKTLLARLIHEESPRKEKPFVTLDCTGFHEPLLESELFGHTKGAFTGAIADKAGRAELADTGTLFLDEVSEIPLSLQGKLMRLVEERTYERVGDPVTRKLDLRIVAATNRDLLELVREKAFREDLFYRLSVVDLTLPPLRSRPEDILCLSRELVARYSAACGKNITGWGDEVERLLLRYSWPGNVRELANALERAVLLSRGKTLLGEHFPPRITEVFDCPGTGCSALSLAQLEEQHIRKILAQSRSIEECARILCIDPSTLWRKRRRYGI